MSRRFIHKPIEDDFHNKLIEWLGGQEVSFCFKGHGWGAHCNASFDLYAGAAIHSMPSRFNEYAEFIESANDFIFTAIPYDFKNKLEDLKSDNIDEVGFVDPVIFIPQITFKILKSNLTVGFLPEYNTKEEVDQLIDKIKNLIPKSIGIASKSRTPKQRMNRDSYLERIKTCKQHLTQGDIYQANICQEFYWSDCQLYGPEVFTRGFESNPNPFSVYFKHKHIHCLSWSPERFLSVCDRQIMSQPMKGTAPRGNTPKEDERLKDLLRKSEKDRRENVMIVDMVRNDLSAHATKGSVNVSDLYTIETYPRVHQMHSTVTAEIKQGSLLLDALVAAFPMASMTGAPKIRAMEIIENLEVTKRGLFSGTIGFFIPEKNADFNVIIRSLIYNENRGHLSCHVGGGITDLSNPEAEYEECLTKVSPILDLVNALHH